MLSQSPPHVPLAFDPESYERACYVVLTKNLSFRRARVVTQRFDLLSRVPRGGTVRCHSKVHDSVEVLVGETPEGVFILGTYPAGNTRFEAAASSADLADALMERLVGELPLRSPDWIDVHLWRYSELGAKRWSRTLSVPEWSEIARNYPDGTAVELARLMRLEYLRRTGGLILFTGAPGTGKTSAIRALLRSWREWSQAHLVPDPERFFGDAAYLIDVVAAGDAEPAMVTRPDGTRSTRWNLVVCEDADDFISRNNRRVAGSGVGRLLNLADGLLGQGLKTAVLLTSNAPIAELDPALSRPGRCIAQIDFQKFDLVSARDWLHDPHAAIPPDGLTLAELYQRCGEVTKLQTTALDGAMTGAYL